MKKCMLLLLTLIFLFVLSACSPAVSDQGNPTGAEDAFVKPDNYASVILVTINPEVRLYLDEQGKVLAAEPVNEDAETIIKDLTLAGKALKDVVEEVVTSANENGFIKPDTTVNFEVQETKSDTVDTVELLKTATETTNNLAADLNIEIAVKSEDKTHTHTYGEATCTAPASCLCGAATGEALGHDYADDKCTRCGALDPNHTHTFSEATCTAPASCPCGETNGEALGHNFANGKCTRCSAPDPNAKYTSVKNKNGSWSFLYVGNGKLNRATFTFNENPVIFGVGTGENIKVMYAGEPPEVLEQIKNESASVEFGGEYYWIASGSGPVPMASMTEDGNTITVTDSDGNKLVLTRTSETTLEVTSSSDKFSEGEGKIPVGTVLTFKAN